MEHRWGQRARVDLPVLIEGRSFDKGDARLSDLSLSGGFVEVDTDVRILCQLQVVVIFPDSLASHALSLDAHVIRKEYRGIGIEWAAFAPAACRTLLRLASRWPHVQRRPADSHAPWVLVDRYEEVAVIPRGIGENRHAPRRVPYAYSDLPVPVSTDEHTSL
jgi:hypothetical protein